MEKSGGTDAASFISSDSCGSNLHVASAAERGGKTVARRGSQNVPVGKRGVLPLPTVMELDSFRVEYYPGGVAPATISLI